MAFTTYAGLQAELLDYGRSDDLSDKVAGFITLAEARLNDLLLLKDYESEESLTLTQDANYVAIPSGYVSPIAFWLIVDGERVALRQVLPEQLPYDTTATQPQEWAIDGANIRFDCPAGEAYTAKFRMYKTSALSDSNTSNYLLLRRPDIYLAGGLVELARYTKDADLFAAWEPKFTKAVAELKAAENRARSTTLSTDLPMARRSNIFRGD
jgi:hypothetical protein